MRKRRLLEYGAILGVVMISVICVACSNKTGGSLTDSSDTVGTGILETTKDQETEKESTYITALPSQEEATSVINSSEANSSHAITPPAQRVYPITNQDAIDIFNDMGLITKDISSADGVSEKATAAFDPNYLYYYRCESFSQAGDAKKCFETIHESALKDDSGRELQGTCDVTEEDGYTELIACGTYDGMSPLYWVAILVDNTVVSGYTFSTAESDKQMINNYFIGLGYM